MELNQVALYVREEIPSRCEIDSLGIVIPEIRITADPALTIEPVEAKILKELCE
jgi:hypothetical protein